MLRDVSSTCNIATRQTRLQIKTMHQHSNQALWISLFFSYMISLQLCLSTSLPSLQFLPHSICSLHCFETFDWVKVAPNDPQMFCFEQPRPSWNIIWKESQHYHCRFSGIFRGAEYFSFVVATSLHHLVMKNTRSLMLLSRKPNHCFFSLKLQKPTNNGHFETVTTPFRYVTYDFVLVFHC